MHHYCVYKSISIFEVQIETGRRAITFQVQKPGWVALPFH